MERELYEAAVEGSVTTLLNLLDRDPLILDRYIIVCFAETPLHIATMLGHWEFAMELLKWKPELARELDSKKSTPLHIASAKGNVNMVKLLLSVNTQMCHARDGRGWNPLHVAAMKGRVDALRELVRVKSEAACIPVDGGSHETILHMCVKHNQLETLKLLLAEISACNSAEFINSKDGNGNTILHLAVIDGQLQTIEFLTKITSIDVNAKNVFGLTSLDLLEIRLNDPGGDYLNIGRLLQHAGAMNSRSNVSLETTGAAANIMSTAAGGSTLEEILNRFLSKQEAWQKQQKRNGRLESQRNTIMIVASLFAAAAFQAGANPPSGFSQFNSNSNDISPTAAPSIPAAAFPFVRPLIVTANATAFFTSAYVFLLLLSGLPLKNKICTGILRVVMWIPIVAAGFSFVFSTALNGVYVDLFSYLIIPPVMFGYIAIFGIIILGHIGRFLVKMVRRCWRKHRSSSSSTAALANRDSV